MDFSENELEEILKIFQVESEEIIARLNNSLVALEKKPNNKDLILTLFRDAHSLKGAARMVGFNNVQELAHKIEDILGLAKENKLQLNAKIADVLYKAVDAISELVQICVEKKSDVDATEIKDKLEALDNIQNLEESEVAPKENEDFDLKTLKENHTRTNELITSSLVSMMKLESEFTDEVTDILLSDMSLLHSIFEDIGFFEIKMSVENIKAKLDFVQKASHSLTAQELSELQNELNNVIVNYSSICEINGIKTVDYYSLAFEKMSGVEQPQTAKTVFQEVEIVEEEQVGSPNDLGCIRKRITEIPRRQDSIEEVKEFLNNFEKNIKNEEIKKVIKLILNIFDYARINKTELDEGTIQAIVESVDYCDNMIKDKAQDSDFTLVLQRLEIIKQVLEINSEQIGANEIASTKRLVVKGSKKIADFNKIFETGEITTMRVDSQKLDTLVNQMGELIVTKIKNKKHLEQFRKINDSITERQKGFAKVLNHLKYYDRKYFQASAENKEGSFLIKQLLNLSAENDHELNKITSEITNLARIIQEDDTKMGLIIDELEGTIKNIRMLPLATVFHMFSRMVRDIAKEKNKKIELEIIGSETCADKRIIEEIKTPLIHIIRNSIDHGIETPEARTSAGKDATGKIILKAQHLDNKILIEIIDDGHGINVQKIREKALKKGFLTEDEIAGMSDADITNLIFAPGFTTGDEVTSISGRGIGLDVVQTKIAQLNGKVNVISELNKGCCTKIELPVTMATLKAFLVESGGQTFAIPMSAVNTVLWKKHEDIRENKDQRTIVFNEKTLQLYRLSEVLNLPQTLDEQTRETVLILESDNKQMAFSVEKLIGDQEILHKKLSAPLYKLKNISGITTLASGEICLIINVKELLKTAVDTLRIPTKRPKKLPLKNEIFGYKKILIVDDSLTTRTLEKNILTSVGLNIDTAINPLEAFKLLGENTYDVIITDIEMPEMNGFEFLAKLKTDEMYADIPVVVVSSVKNADYKKKAQKMKAAKYIVKGEFNQTEFLDTITNLLD